MFILKILKEFKIQIKHEWKLGMNGELVSEETWTKGTKGTKDIEQIFRVNLNIHYYCAVLLYLQLFKMYYYDQISNTGKSRSKPGQKIHLLIPTNSEYLEGISQPSLEFKNERTKCTAVTKGEVKQFTIYKKIYYPCK